MGDLEAGGLPVPFVAGTIETTSSATQCNQVSFSGIQRRGGEVGAGVARVRSESRRLLVSTHGRLLWLDVDTKESSVIHEGRGVYYGAFPGVEDGPCGRVWVISRPHNWR